MRTKTPSFIAEQELAVSRAHTKTLEKRFRAATALYNDVLAEALSRLRQLRSDPDFAKAKTLSKSKEKTEAYRQLRLLHGFTEASLQKFSEHVQNSSWIGDHLRGHATQTTAKRAFLAAERYAFAPKGSRVGRPRFKRGGQLSSIEGKEDSCLVIRDNVFKWSGLTVPVIPERGPWWDQAHACPTKFNRIVRRTIRGRARYFVQSIKAGTAPQRYEIGAGIGAIDIGPSQVAIFVPEKLAAVIPLAPSITEPVKLKQRLQRKLDRSRRATNPGNYNPDGTVRGGRKVWVKTQTYRRTKAELAEVLRKLAATRKREHGQLTNQMLGLAGTWLGESLSYRSFQRNYGRSSRDRAAGLFISTLSRKAESAGGEFRDFETRTTRLSQFDHSTGNYVKKPLSQRIHVFGDPAIRPVHRDLYSAFLATAVVHTHSGDELDKARVLALWPGAEPLLRQPLSSLPQPTKRPGFAQPTEHASSVRVGRLQTVGHASGNTSKPLRDTPLPLAFQTSQV